MAYATGKRICQLVLDDVRPSQIMTREAFENAIVVASALGASSNCPPHLIAIARHMGDRFRLFVAYGDVAGDGVASVLRIGQHGALRSVAFTGHVG